MDSTKISATLDENIKQPVQHLAQQGKEKLRTGVESALSQQKDTIAETLGSFSQVIHEVGSRLEQQGNPMLGKYLHKSHRAVDSFSGYLREHEFVDIMNDVQSVAKKSPALLVGSLFAAGFLAGRFLKSSAPEPYVTALVPYEEGGVDPNLNTNLRGQTRWR